MPGYSQLKKLSEEILKLGNEPKLRADRGEKSIPVEIPSSIPDVDDSEDFVMGMPERPEDEPAPVQEEESEDDFQALLSGETPKSKTASEDSDVQEPAAPSVNLDSILAEIQNGGDVDLSDFDEEPEPEEEPEPPSVADMSLDDLLNTRSEMDEEPEEDGINGSGYSGFGHDSSAEDIVPDSFDIDSVLSDIGAQAKKNEEPEDISEPEELAELEPEELSEQPLSDSEPDIFADIKAQTAGQTKSDSEVPVFEVPDLSTLPDGGKGILTSETDLSEIDALEKELEVARNISAVPSEPAPKKTNPETDFDFSLDEDEAVPAEEAAPEEKNEEPVDFSSDLADLGDFSEIADLDSDLSFEEPSAEPVEEPVSELAEEPIAEPVEEPSPSGSGDEDFALPVDDISFDEPAQAEQKSEENPYSDFDDDFAFEGAGIDMNADLPDELQEVPPEVSAFEAPERKSEESEEPAVPEMPVDDGAGEALVEGLSDDVFSTEGMDSFGTEDAGAEADPFSTEGMDSFGTEDAGTESDPFSTEGMDSFGTEDAGTEADPFSTEGMDSFGTEDAGTEADPFSTEGMDSFGTEDAGTEADPFSTEGMDSFGTEDAGAEADPFSTEGMDSFDADAVSDPFNTDDMDAFGAAPDASAPVDAFDPSIMDGIDFDAPQSEAPESEGGDASIEDFTVPETDAKLKGDTEEASADFDLAGDGDFTIPGFSDTDADPFAAKKEEKVKLPVADFTGALEGDGKLNNALTDAQYTVFKKNLMEYPLNLRIAVEDMIVKNEFTDEVVFEVIEKILKKVTARQLAGHLEKMLDIQIPIPKDFEKRTAAEYEAYKASLQYQLKNRILPVAIISLIAVMLLSCIGYLSYLFIYNPLMAEKHYKQGYTLLERDEYPQSETEFNEALKFKSKKNWFYKYAQGYRNHKQYDRAEMMYKAILKRYNHDKQAGLEYADMEVSDLANYELAETILRREVLDYFINDQDGILALGDTYLEWATEKDSSKFEDAFEQYSMLIQLYGSNDVNLSRMLRYNIRTDQLRNVLELKESFYPREKSLSAGDWTEMSGYLMDKLFGELPAGQEYLREKIEDVRDMLLLAVKADPANPLSNYNLSRYFVEVGDHNKSMQSLKTTEKLFENIPQLKRRDIYKQINTYRLLGEEYLYQREYIMAEETFSDGLDLFESRKRNSGLEGDRNIGLMYGDMGDINYFLSGDLNSAYRNYAAAVENENDTPSIRYRLGYINYGKNEYDRALGNFIKATQQTGNDSHLLLALGNTLSLKDDNYAAQGYYERLIAYMDLEREKHGIEVPQVQPEAGDLVETYMKTANNLGVTMHRLAKQTGSSSLNAKSMVQFQNSIRYWDALTRNQETMVRLPGSNLAEQNLRYVTRPLPDYEPAIYTEIPRMMYGEKGLEQ